jgi:hypothetical protein
MLAAFVVAVGSAFAAQSKTLLLNNRRDASCSQIVGACTLAGAHVCDQQLQYDINDTNCQTSFDRKP